jgi:hypothetical protein
MYADKKDLSTSDDQDSKTAVALGIINADETNNHP